MKIIFDSSTLILLAKVNLLREASDEVEIIIPEEVKREALMKRTEDAELISILIQERKIIVQKADEAKAIKKLQIDFRLAKGEAEALWLSKKRQCPVAIDDGPGIRTSKVLGLRFLTAVHVLLHMASQNKLSSALAQEKLIKLVQYGRYNKRIIEDAMSRSKEGRK
jgi:predicted nucleic acid-binding protein